MSFDFMKWIRDMRAQAAAERSFEKKMAALRKKTARAVRGQSGRALRGSRRGRATRGQGRWNKSGKTVSILFKKHNGSVAGDRYSEAAEGAERTCSSMLGRSSKDRIPEWEIDYARQPTISRNKLIVHVTLSRPEGHSLTGQQWSDFAKKFLHEAGASGVNYICTRHPGTHDHVHLVFSRVLPDGTLLSDSNDYWKFRNAAQLAAHSMGLNVDADRDVEFPMAPTDRAVSAQRRATRRKTSNEVWVRPETVKAALQDATSLQHFQSSLLHHGIELKLAQLSPEAKPTGILYRRAGAEEWLAGSSLDRSLSLSHVLSVINANCLRNPVRPVPQHRQNLGVRRPSTPPPLGQPPRER